MSVAVTVGALGQATVQEPEYELPTSNSPEGLLAGSLPASGEFDASAPPGTLLASADESGRDPPASSPLLDVFGLVPHPLNAATSRLASKTKAPPKRGWVRFTIMIVAPQALSLICP
jgi:hypothetical protein